MIEGLAVLVGFVSAMALLFGFVEFALDSLEKALDRSQEEDE